MEYITVELDSPWFQSFLNRLPKQKLKYYYYDFTYEREGKETRKVTICLKVSKYICPRTKEVTGHAYIQPGYSIKAPDSICHLKYDEELKNTISKGRADKGNFSSTFSITGTLVNGELLKVIAKQVFRQLLPDIDKMRY